MDITAAVRASFGTGYDWQWNVVFNSQTMAAIGYGVRLTIEVSILGLVFGSILGMLAALSRTARVPVLRQVAYVYVEFFRTTPALVQIIWIFYVIPVVAGIHVSPLTAGVSALALNSGAFLAEIFRAGIQSISRGQSDAARVLGMTSWMTFRHVILPQAMRRVLPPTSNVFISLIKDSSLLSVIAVGELTYQMQSQVAETFRPFELYTALAIVYFILTYSLSLASSGLERKYRVT